MGSPRCRNRKGGAMRRERRVPARRHGWKPAHWHLESIHPIESPWCAFHSRPTATDENEGTTAALVKGAIKPRRRAEGCGDPRSIAASPLLAIGIRPVFRRRACLRHYFLSTTSPTQPPRPTGQLSLAKFLQQRAMRRADANSQIPPRSCTLSHPPAPPPLALPGGAQLPGL
jgi:hypothetical protein